MCGNHSECNHYVYFLRGSPPRVREPPQVAGVWKQWRRITPACAGTTDFAVSSASFPKDHPRVCGNHAIQITTQAHISGSPPRVREPPAIPSRTDSRIRITPACAGTTTLYFIVDNYCWDHPRVCGNHSTGLPPMSFLRGSPPRVREPLDGQCPSNQSTRITPACAGTTVPRSSRASQEEDHPRVCGNHI